MENEKKLLDECKNLNLSLLVRYKERNERRTEVLSTVYEVVHSSQLRESGPGTVVYERSGDKSVKAKIISIAEHKEFLDAEMSTIAKQPGAVVVRKRKMEHQSHSMQYSSIDSDSETSIVSVPSSVVIHQHKRNRKKATPSPIEYPSNSMQYNSNESIDSDAERLIITVPPMTFDQGSQTEQTQTSMQSNDLKTIQSKQTKTQAKDLLEIKAQLHTMQVEHQQLKKLNEQTMKLLSDISSLTYDVKTILKTIAKNGEVSDRDPHIINSQMKANNKPIVLFAHTSNEMITMDDNVTIETIDETNDSSICYSNCSRMSPASSASILNSTTMASQQSSSAGESTNVSHASLVKDEVAYDCSEADAFGQVVIGRNGTKVPISELKKAKWESYSSVTRMLLISLFGRNVLATHSLTGKRSPAFINSSKPTKNQLDPSVTSDIVEFVVSKCSQATPTAVRAAITTKCADENKMLRQRQAKEKRHRVLQSVDNSNNKENHGDGKVMSHNATL